MTSPLWIVNSSLAIAVILGAGIFFLGSPKIPSRSSIRPEATPPLAKKDVSKADLTRIYQNDLFGTNITPERPKEPEEPVMPVMPAPPAPVAPAPIKEEKPEFLAPLPINLKGVIIASTNEENRAFIGNTKTGKEDVFKISDTVEDAELIFIGKNKITLIRPNGQQETVFITPDDADDDITYYKPVWAEIVQKTGDATYTVDPEAFVENFTSLAQILDELDMTTAFSKGISLGVQVGSQKPASLGGALGLQPGDIITAINGISTNSTDKRIEIYEALQKLHDGNAIIVSLLRNNNHLDLVYNLAPLEKDEDEPAKITTQSNEPVQERTVALLKEENDLDAARNAMKKNDQLAMLSFGGRGNALRRTRS